MNSRSASARCWSRFWLQCYPAAFVLPLLATSLFAASIAPSSAAGASAAALNFTQTPFRLPIETASLTAVDLNGDVKPHF